MSRLYYKGVNSSIKPQEKEKRFSLILNYKMSHKWVNLETGEIKEEYPPICYDNREKRREIKEANSNSYANRLRELLGESAYFYTINLYDVYSSWGDYDSIFNPEKVPKIKNYISRYIKGPYMAGMELSAYTGNHVHILSRFQDFKHCKSERVVYDYFGLIGYMSKSVINPKDKDNNPEEYDLICGTYLEWKGRIGNKYLPRRSWARLRG